MKLYTRQGNEPSGSDEGGVQEGDGCRVDDPESSRTTTEWKSEKDSELANIMKRLFIWDMTDLGKRWQQSSLLPPSRGRQPAERIQRVYCSDHRINTRKKYQPTTGMNCKAASQAQNAGRVQSPPAGEPGR